MLREVSIELDARIGRVVDPLRSEKISSLELASRINHIAKQEYSKYSRILREDGNAVTEVEILNMAHEILIRYLLRTDMNPKPATRRTRTGIKNAS